MKGTIISPDSDFYTVKDLDVFITDITKEIPLKDLIESQEFSLQVHDGLEKMVAEGKLEKVGDGTEEDESFEEVRKTIKYLKQKLKSQSCGKVVIAESQHKSVLKKQPNPNQKGERIR